MYDTHQVLPLKAYDIHGDLIHLTQYKTKLQNALVHIEFTMAHWVIWKKKTATDTFVADLLSIRVLQEPKPPVTISPQKAVTHTHDPFESESETEKELPMMKRQKRCCISKPCQHHKGTGPVIFLFFHCLHEDLPRRTINGIYIYSLAILLLSIAHPPVPCRHSCSLRDYNYLSRLSSALSTHLWHVNVCTTDQILGNPQLTPPYI